MINSILSLAKSCKDKFIVYTLRSPFNKTESYSKLKNNKLKNIIIKEIDIPNEWKFLYSISPGEDRFRWDAESLFFNKIVFPRLISDNRDLVWVNYILDAPIIPINIPSILNLLGYPRNKSDYAEGLMHQYSEIISNSSNVIEKRNKLLNNKLKDFKILYQGIDCTKDTKKISLFNKNKFTIMFGGRFIRRKGISILINAVEILIKKGITDVELYLFGEGIFKKDIKRLIDNKKLGKYIKIKRFVDNIEDYISSADVCVFPSLDGEGLMSIVLESLYYNGVVITTSNNGNEEAIVDKKNGFIVAQGDPIVLAKRLESIKNGKFDLNNIKISAKKAILENFSWEKYNRNFLKIINNYR